MQFMPCLQSTGNQEIKLCTCR